MQVDVSLTDYTIAWHYLCEDERRAVVRLRRCPRTRVDGTLGSCMWARGWGGDEPCHALLG